ncbi:hypothetical protein P3436_25310, partial [Vibrio parahaemolyticus]|nr:hypothetical protein [Vibrio parahaemolyticus]
TSGAAAGSVALAWGPLSPGGVEGGRVARGRRLHVMVFPLWFFRAQPYFYLLLYLFISGVWIQLRQTDGNLKWH